MSYKGNTILVQEVCLSLEGSSGQFTLNIYFTMRNNQVHEKNFSFNNGSTERYADLYLHKQQLIILNSSVHAPASSLTSRSTEVLTLQYL